MNPRLLQYLRSLGLPANATEQEAEQFLNKLTGPQLDFARSLMNDPGQSSTSQADDEEDDDVDQEEDEEEEDEEQEDDEEEPEQRTRRGNRRQRTAARSAAQASERRRSLEILELAEQLKFGSKWAQKMIASKLTLQQVRNKALDRVASRANPVNTNAGPAGNSGGNGSVRVGEDRNLDTLSIAIHDAIMLRTGAQNIAKTDDDGNVLMSDERRRDSNGDMITMAQTRQPHERAREFRGLSLSEMARSYLNNVGVDTTGMSRTRVCQLVFNTRKLMQMGAYTPMSSAISHTTSDFPAILADVANKTLRQGYLEAPRSWPIWCRRATAPDFKDINRTQLGAVPTLREVPEGAEIKQVTIGDAKQAYNLLTYGEIFALTWQSLINDDTDGFTRTPMLMGNAATRREEYLVYQNVINSNVLADGSTLFSTGNVNLATGADSGLPSVEQLNYHYALMQKQTGLAGEILDLTPSFILVPSELRGLALELITSQAKPGDNQGHTRNIWYGQLDVISTAWLSQNSDTAWYLAASPNMIDTVEVCFLEDEQQPVIEQEESFDVFGRRFRVRHSVAAAAIDHRGLTKDTGVGS